MKKVKILSLLLVITLFLISYVWGENTIVKSKPQTTCPIMGGEINKNIHADFRGKRVYFCCKGCIAEFQKNPEKHINKLEDTGVTLEEAPKAGNKDKSSYGTKDGGEQSKARGGCGCSSCS